MTSNGNNVCSPRRLKLLMCTVVLVALLFYLFYFQESHKKKILTFLEPKLSAEEAIIKSNIKPLIFALSLKEKENRIFSQNKEDGILEAIFDMIKPKTKYYVEFGVENGMQCNTRYFREKKGWTGLLMDGSNENAKINLVKEMIFPNNIIQLFQKYKVPKQFDLFSEDTDFKDFWLIKNILDAGYRPRVIISEMNSFLGPNASLSVPLDSAETRWDGGSQYFGYSVAAGWHLARFYGYSMVYCEFEGVNCFYVIDGEEGFGKDTKLSDFLLPAMLWKRPYRLSHRKDTKNRPYKRITPNLL